MFTSSGSIRTLQEFDTITLCLARTRKNSHIPNRDPNILQNTEHRLPDNSSHSARHSSIIHVIMANIQAQQHQTNYIQMHQKVKIALHYDSSYSPYCKSIRVLGSTLLSFFLSIRLVTKLSTETSSWLLTSNNFLE